MNKTTTIASFAAAGLILLAGATFFAARLLNGGLTEETGLANLMALAGRDRATRSIEVEKSE